MVHVEEISFENCKKIKAPNMYNIMLREELQPMSSYVFSKILDLKPKNLNWKVENSVCINQGNIHYGCKTIIFK